jgi:hypothetical protein
MSNEDSLARAEHLLNEMLEKWKAEGWSNRLKQAPAKSDDTLALLHELLRKLKEPES